MQCPGRSPGGGKGALMLRIFASFDWLASHYGWMESLVAGSRLQECRTAWLEELKPVRVLAVGEGHGKFVAALLRRHPEAKVTCVDSGRAMLEAAKKRLAREGLSPERVRWVHACLPGWRPEAGAYDLVVTQFFLDCFQGRVLEEVVQELAAGCVPGGCWLVSDFQVPGSGIRRWRAKAIVWAMYRFFRNFTSIPAFRLDDPAPLLAAAGFGSGMKVEMEWGLLYSQLWRRNMPQGPGGLNRANMARSLA